MQDTKTVEAGEPETRNKAAAYMARNPLPASPNDLASMGAGEKTFVRYVDMTPTWLGILPVLLETKDHPDSAQELEKMARLADRLNAPLHKAASDILEELKKQVEYMARVNPMGEDSKAVKSARAAIRKAERN